MIEVKNITKSFIRQEKKGKKEEFNAVDDVSFTAGSGEIVGILGPNGAGKTTLLRILGGLMQPNNGEIIIKSADGKTITDKNEKKAHIGYLSENTRLYTRFTVREMLSIYAELYGYEKEEGADRISKIEEIMEMSEFIDNRIEKLSTGQKQRTSIARCLLHNPDIYIFDEPTLGLDIISSRSIIEFMKEEKKNNKCVLYSTHYMEEAEFLCDRIVMINHGKIIAEGTPKELDEKTGTTNLRDAFFKIVEESGDKLDEPV
ncbi:MAG: ATP-binding cassette domain-containing protein [Lachnospiraceae bacterium]|nr:ATP-binding cassette domain-containing protein [Lachnospiraceae bacterium]